MGRPDFIVIDVETTGLRIHNGDRAFLVGGMLPDGSTGLINIGVGPYDTSGADVLGLLRDPLVYKIMHNAKFDLNALRRVDIKVAGPVIDTMVLAQLHGRQHPSYGLKELSAEILGRPHLSVAARDAWLADYKKANGLDAPWDLIPRSIMEPYLMEDLECTRRLFEALWPMVKDHPSLDMEMALVHVVAEMEYNGMPVDVALLRLEQVNLDLRSQALRQAAVDLSGRPEFNPASSKQLADVLYRERGQVVRHNTPKGAPSTDTDALGEMVDPLVDTVLELRAAEKVRGTYVEGLLARVDGDGSVHPSLHQNGAITTGRFSCSDPNLQNLPRVDEADVASPYNIVRRAFIPDPGGMMLFADYNQIEARLFAHYSCDPKMIQPILNGQDLHELTSNMLFGGGWGEEERKALRQVAKTLNFATLYGAGAEQLASQIRRLLRGYKNAGLKSLQNCSSLDARGIRAHYFKVYPGVHGLMTQTKNEILRTAGADGMGHVVDVFGNRYVAHRQKAYRAANYLVQGTAAHLMKRALVDLYNNINGGPLRGELYILNTIHDEVILEVREEYYNNNKEKILRCIKTSMEDHNTFRVPITVELSYSNTNWKEKKKIQELSV